MDNLLIELGAEEIPAGYIEPALAAFSSMVLQKLGQFRIEHGNARTFGTPRRLAVEVEDVAVKQTSLVTEVLGPPKKIGVDNLVLIPTPDSDSYLRCWAVRTPG